MNLSSKVFFFIVNMKKMVKVLAHYNVNDLEEN
jgi:hypothetical protein